mmetsp:Transcript_12097/g.33457  ORF Transcript_12097/g.33457 Transcript_12097/m.33457 type:complete len:150 (+) Transcript_12097:93-542(+)|eukprot:CAMPEP_0113699284 /NCGR_PEP_ID=MMETSP0038_2-20120614/23216_1 /TAXON_ID=2898 /ORGANISM="Cryptomonas paramecium" /LENGTH=149 /DNA_ID=CAMNT_0000622613 /DNA_START=54 /DNA_END=503 /DNA_ORIENTATION=+ /assembly_acc=CAM_ASM_000170
MFTPAIFKGTNNFTDTQHFPIMQETSVNKAAPARSETAKDRVAKQIHQLFSLEEELGPASMTAGLVDLAAGRDTSGNASSEISAFEEPVRRILPSSAPAPPPTLFQRPRVRRAHIETTNQQSNDRNEEAVTSVSRDRADLFLIAISASQ